jgi:formate hydrogenlyase transcriptional activator
LLRVLQEREFERLGSSRTLRTNVRLIAATNRNLESLVQDQQFRSDLFYRLNVFPIHVPPLRERPEDVPLLVRHFVQRLARRMNKTIDTIHTKTMDALRQHSWPGNIRELENVIERALILSRGPELQVALAEFRSSATRQSGGRQQTLEQVERDHIVATLKDTKWVLGGPKGAAARLGMNRSTLQFRMKKLGIVRGVEASVRPNGESAGGRALGEAGSLHGDAHSTSPGADSIGGWRKRRLRNHLDPCDGRKRNRNLRSP